ncbi:uncharacterized protein PGTG_01438 [Puccinia graminis f. sp. tritici CRL 75-36-700-3]|uniref:Uncharacterized protein n=1 Tax=Puccinia graminis f. sp. tritici (strain CRL 75-36-700-3 / race SCCL) TaxID=418459 RepID=E3JSC0_PUCGT|nr:uncharacterized protein PGTG_01438 [Puccinia graminis f. sp. tritici CRL 75-36-700-3]EFP74845.2 hypothetical protein PGTG_01438 [Puccinia graminis f. sp. tritici CRL 75-36-700-3]
MSAAYRRATHIPPGGHGSTPRPRRPPGFKAANLTSADRKVWLGRRRSVRPSRYRAGCRRDAPVVDHINQLGIFLFGHISNSKPEDDMFAAVVVSTTIIAVAHLYFTRQETPRQEGHRREAEQKRQEAERKRQEAERKRQEAHAAMMKIQEEILLRVRELAKAVAELKITHDSRL